MNLLGYVVFAFKFSFPLQVNVYILKTPSIILHDVRRFKPFYILPPSRVFLRHFIQLVGLYMPNTSSQSASAMSATLHISHNWKRQ